MIYKWFKRLFGIGNIAGSAIGLAILFGCLAVGLALNAKTGAVIIAWGGGIIGTFLLQPFLNGLFVPEAANGRALKQKLTEQMEENARLKKEVPTLEEKIAHLQGQRIKVTNFEAVMKLSLCSVDSTLPDFQRLRFSKTGEAIPSDGSVLNIGDYEYIGCTITAFKALLGVDLNKIRVVEDAKQLVIFGIKAEPHGFDGLPTKTWSLQEIRCQERSVSSLLSGELVVQANHPKLTKLSDEQNSSVQARLNQGTMIPALDDAIEGMARQFVESLLGSQGKTITFSDSDSISGQLLPDFIQAHNSVLEGKILDLKSQRTI